MSILSHEIDKLDGLPPSEIAATIRSAGLDLTVCAPEDTDRCPVAAYLSHKVGKPVSVPGYAAFVRGHPNSFVTLPPSVRNFIDALDLLARMARNGAC